MTTTVDPAMSRSGRARVGGLPAPTGKPTVSIVIPCHNYGRFLPDAVRSALSQTGVSVEVIVVDDASTDHSYAVAQRLSTRDHRITVLSNAVNLGPVATFNRGLELATGEYLVRLDADDLLTRGSLSRSVAVASAVPTAGFVYGRPRHFVGDVPRHHRSRVVGWRTWPGRRWLADRCRDGLNVITSPEVLMRRSVVEQVGGQRELRHTHDMEMWFRIAAVSDVAYVIGPEQAFHREHPGSLSASQQGPMEDLRERRLAFDTLFLSPPGSELGAARELHVQAIDALARGALNMACHGFDRASMSSELMEQLHAFAIDSAPGIETSKEYRALERRLHHRRLGARRRAAYTIAANKRAASGRLRRLTWLNFGTYDGR